MTSGPGAGFDTLYTIYALSGIWRACPSHCNSRIGEAQWLSGRELDSRRRGHGFELHQRHCAMSLSKTHSLTLTIVRPANRDWACQTERCATLSN